MMPLCLVLAGFPRITTVCLQLHLIVCLCQIEPYIPYEFTCEGMLQRVNVLVEKQVRKMSTNDTDYFYFEDVVRKKSCHLNMCSAHRICAARLGTGRHSLRSRL